MIINKFAIAVLALAGAASIPAGAQTVAGPAIVVAQATASAMTEAEVRKVDKDAAKLTLKHGPIPNLDMGAMTMVFRVKDPAMLEQVKQGDKIKFSAEKIGGQYTVTGIEKP